MLVGKEVLKTWSCKSNGDLEVILNLIIQCLNVFPARKKSRWGSEQDKLPPEAAAALAAASAAATGATAAHLQGKSPELIQYAIRVFGRTELEPHEWKQCQDQLQVRRS